MNGKTPGGCVEVQEANRRLRKAFANGFLAGALVACAVSLMAGLAGMMLAGAL